ncbi:MAG: hypothetical protein JEZ08_21530 [Clostridiales bacterium]|nr:hypothetical protein [Clostridiales bacterium]
MSIISIAMCIFIVLELMNVTMLYFNPGSKLGNGIGVFNAWEQSQKNEAVHALVKYLVYWVAGTKLIFIGLLLVILFTGSELTQTLSAVVLILSILSFYWRLYPIIKGLDQQEQISPKGYSKTLGIMIACFILMFSVALVVSLF